MLRCLDLSRAELSVAMTDDDEIRELNRVFRHRDRATDVLAFAMREGEPTPPTTAAATSSRKGRRNVTTSATARAEHGGEVLGDVVISVETARRQATRRRRPLDAEVRMLLAHGLLHLVGYDHQTKREEAVMVAETERLCRAAGARRSEPSSGRTGQRGTRGD